MSSRVRLWQRALILLLAVASPATLCAFSRRPRAPEAAARPAKSALLGTWKGAYTERSGKQRPMPEGVLMRVTFQTGGKLVSITGYRGKRVRKVGNWTVDGDQLTTRIDKHVESARFEVSAKSLTLYKNGGRIKLHLLRVQ